jgi:hypothetical protein
MQHFAAERQFQPQREAAFPIHLEAGSVAPVRPAYLTRGKCPSVGLNFRKRLPCTQFCEQNTRVSALDQRYLDLRLVAERSGEADRRFIADSSPSGHIH